MRLSVHFQKGFVLCTLYNCTCLTYLWTGQAAPAPAAISWEGSKALSEKNPTHPRWIPELSLRDQRRQGAFSTEPASTGSFSTQLFLTQPKPLGTGGWPSVPCGHTPRCLFMHNNQLVRCPPAHALWIRFTRLSELLTVWASCFRTKKTRKRRNCLQQRACFQRIGRLSPLEGTETSPNRSQGWLWFFQCENNVVTTWLRHHMAALPSMRVLCNLLGVTELGHSTSALASGWGLASVPLRTREWQSRKGPLGYLFARSLSLWPSEHS